MLRPRSANSDTRNCVRFDPLLLFKRSKRPVKAVLTRIEKQGLGGATLIDGKGGSKMPGQQIGNAVDGMIGDSRQHVT